MSGIKKKYKVIEDKCKVCGRCVSACPAKAIAVYDEYAVIDEKRCKGCGRCKIACIHKAIVEA